MVNKLQSQAKLITEKQYFYTIRYYLKFFHIWFFLNTPDCFLNFI